MESMLSQFIVEYSGESLLVIVIAGLAAVFDVFLKNKLKNSKTLPPPPQEHSNAQTLEMMKQAFEGLQKTMESLQAQYTTLQDQYILLKNEADTYREKYYNQIEVNSKQSGQLTKVSSQLILLQEKCNEILDMKTKPED